MILIPVINCPDINSVRERMSLLEGFHERDGWVHLDVTDGIFSTHETWHDPAAWPAIGGGFALEVHLMVKKPEDYIGAWIAAGAQRIIVHVETITPETAPAIATVAKQHGVELMLAIDPETPLDNVLPFAGFFSAFQILAVHPGAGGQELMPSAIEKIFALRKDFPNGTIEIDGGINVQTARLAKEAGADVITSDHYIFSAEYPEKAYEELRNI